MRVGAAACVGGYGDGPGSGSQDSGVVGGHLFGLIQ